MVPGQRFTKQGAENKLGRAVRTLVSPSAVIQGTTGRVVRAEESTVVMISWWSGMREFPTAAIRTGSPKTSTRIICRKSALRGFAEWGDSQAQLFRRVVLVRPLGPADATAVLSHKITRRLVARQYTQERRIPPDSSTSDTNFSASGSLVTSVITAGLPF